jgi:ABC-type Fe3+/spermidine/putrescine transport system ATPase subunit
VHEELGTTTLHVSHNFEETLAVADRIGIIHQGRIRQVGTPEEVFRRPNSEFVAQFVRTENVLRGTARAGGSGLVVTVGEVELEAESGPEGDVFLTVRPEEVALARAGGEARPNQRTGRVVRVVDKGALMRVAVEAGVTLVSLVARRAFQRSGLGVGDEAVVSFDPGAAHVFAAE